MRLHPDAQRVLDLVRASGRPPFETLDPREARELYRAGRAVLQPDPPPVALTRDLAAPAPHGTIPLRLYRGLGTEATARLPALVYFHGGGWVFGDLDTHDVVCRQLANDARCAIVAVDYRVAPEDKFPAAVEDAIAATRWIAANAASLGLDAARLAVGGDSAGGNLATVVALDARDRGGPALRYQLLVYPAVEFAMTHESHRRFTEGVPLTSRTVAWFRDLYLRDAADRADWRASPLRAPDLAALPPAYLLTAGFDPLADEGDDYAQRLAAAGVAVTRRHVDDQIHGFLTMGRFIAASSTTIADAAAALREAFTPPASGGAPTR
jgi:acetyl esterase